MLGGPLLVQRYDRNLPNHQAREAARINTERDPMRAGQHRGDPFSPELFHELRRLPVAASQRLEMHLGGASLAVIERLHLMRRLHGPSHPQPGPAPVHLAVMPAGVKSRLAQKIGAHMLVDRADTATKLEKLHKDVFATHVDRALERDASAPRSQSFDVRSAQGYARHVLARTPWARLPRELARLEAVMPRGPDATVLALMQRTLRAVPTGPVGGRGAAGSHGAAGAGPGLALGRPGGEAARRHPGPGVGALGGGELAPHG